MYSCGKIDTLSTMDSIKKRQLIIIGIDGGTYKVIDPLVKKGRLPNLKKIMDSGTKGILKSTIPSITAAAWVSFMTGMGPGKHGFYDFREYNIEKYDVTDASHVRDAIKDNISTLHSSRFRGQTIWDFLSTAGYEMNVIAVPMTYPPWKIKGKMVSGYPCPDYKKPKTYPPEWGEEIGQLFNMSAIDYSKIDEFIVEAKELVSMKARIFLNELKRRRGEVFSIVFSSSDFVQHFFWKFLEQENHIYSSVIGDIYHEIDKVVGELLACSDQDASIYVISDHGFAGNPGKLFHMNCWLAEEGYLSLKGRGKPQVRNPVSQMLDTCLDFLRYRQTKLRWLIKGSIDRMPVFIRRWASQQYYKSNLIDWETTRTYRYKMYGSTEGIVINRKGRQEKGIVEEGAEYDRVREDIVNKLMQLRDSDTGDRIIDAVYLREDLYHGAYSKNAPDIIVNYASNYCGGLEVSGRVITPNIAREGAESGIHDRNGIFMCSGPHFKKGDEISDANIVDVVPTILYDCGLPIPDDIDGKIMEEAFLDSYRKNKPRYVVIDRAGGGTQELLPEGDEESIKKALKGLGYLE
jgi:predicted AlkP superfamily phosphohydrolase/phosphomutase